MSPGSAGQFHGLDYLACATAWNVDWAQSQAQRLGIQSLTAEQIELLSITRRLHAQYQRLPPTRLYLKALSLEYNTPISMLTLIQWMDWTEKPIHLIQFLAGLPPPSHCL